MNNISIIELLLISIIVVVQTLLAIKIFKQIRLLNEVIPEIRFFKISKFNIPIEDLQAFEPKEILQNLSIYEKEVNFKQEPVYAENGQGGFNFESETQDEDDDADAHNEVSLINPNQLTNPIFDEILSALNVYLLRNKGAATDFNLIKDVVERNVDAEEEDISQTVTIPLYLGLMGTMIGIVFGLVSIFWVSDAKSDFDIKAFLGGVSLAMIASFWGLFCTIGNASFNLKRAKRNLEKSKNNFYTFIQTELLPLLNQSVSSSVHRLNENLIRFNDNFTVNLNRLTVMLNKNHDALIAQERILQSLDDINIVEFAKANVIVLKQLKLGTGQLEKFADYLNSLNFLAAKTSKLSTSFDEVLNRTNNFQGLAEKLDSRVAESNKLVQFLNDHFQQLKNRSDLINDSVMKVDDVIMKSMHHFDEQLNNRKNLIIDSVVKVEDIMIKSLNQLEEHTQEKIEAIKQQEKSVEDFLRKSLNQIDEQTQVQIESIKQLAKKEEDLLATAFAENRSHISKLSFLENLKDSVEEMKVSSAGQMGSIKEEVKSLKNSVDSSNNVLQEINEKTLVPHPPKVSQLLKRFFGSKNDIS